MTGRLAGKIAIITGATSRIGESTARRFAEERAKVLIAGRNVDKGEALVRELGSDVVFQAADVMVEADIAAPVDSAMSRFGRLDCLFNNASVAAHRFAQGGMLYSAANAAVLLASDEGSFVNCHDLVVDGGRIAQFDERLPAAG